VFPTFVDISGQRAPTLGSHARTVAAAFGGNEAAFNAVDPLHELKTRRYRRSAGFVIVGAEDRTYRPQAVEVAAAARAAGMSITFAELPGHHNWSVWRPALPRALSWLGSRMGITR
jgi:S-formylglutathione hydrolase FrmB